MQRASVRRVVFVGDLFDVLFPVVYNVRKRTRHLPHNLRRTVMEGVLDMHYATSLERFNQIKHDVYQQWLSTPQLQGFARYFAKQWLDSRYSRWQIFHTPRNFNATIKMYTRRRRYPMQRLLEIVCKIVKNAPVRKPTGEFDVLPPSRDLTKSANAMITGGWIAVYRTPHPSVVRVDQRKTTSASFVEEMEEFRSVIDGPFGKTTGNASFEGNPPDPDEILSASLILREERSKASRLYASIVKRSMKRAHLSGMPPGGWEVDVVSCVCPCDYFAKHRSCAHLIAGRKARKLSIPGQIDTTAKLFNRNVRQRTKPSPSDAASGTTTAPVTTVTTLSSTTVAARAEVPTASAAGDETRYDDPSNRVWPEHSYLCSSHEAGSLCVNHHQPFNYPLPSPADSLSPPQHSWHHQPSQNYQHLQPLQQHYQPLYRMPWPLPHQMEQLLQPQHQWHYHHQAEPLLQPQHQWYYHHQGGQPLLQHPQQQVPQLQHPQQQLRDPTRPHYNPAQHPRVQQLDPVAPPLGTERIAIVEQAPVRGRPALATRAMHVMDARL